MVGAGLERGLQHGHRLGVEAAIRRGEGARLRGLGEGVGIGRREAGCTRVGIAGLGEFALALVGHAQQHPAFFLAGIARQRSLELGDRFADGFRRAERGGIERVGRADDAVEQAGGDQHQGADGEGDAARLAPERTQQHREHGECQRQRDREEADVHHSCSSSGATTRSAGLRRRTTTATTPAPASSSRAGPAHSSQVRPSMRGLYSTNSP